MAYTEAQLNTMLAEARAAYHDLILGRSARVVIDQNGERVEFVAANSSKLYIYIQDLERQLAALQSVTTTPTNGPARFLF